VVSDRSCDNECSRRGNLGRGGYVWDGLGFGGCNNSCTAVREKVCSPRIDLGVRGNSYEKESTNITMRHARCLKDINVSQAVSLVERY
jgi:hypothetical protein